MMNRQASKRIAAIKKTAAVLLFLTTGILVVLAQDPPPPPPPPAPISGQSVVPPPPPPPASDKIAVSPQSPTPPPPPPPPPPVGQNMSDGSEWWMKILIKHHVTPRAYNNFQNIFEMGKTNSISNDIVTLEDAWMIINMPDTYMVIESPLIFHDLVKNTIRGNEASVKVYYHGTSDLTPISTLDLKDFSMEVEKNGVPSDKTKLKADSVEFLQ